MPWHGLRRAVTLLTAIPLPAGKSTAGPAAGQPTARQAAAVMYWAPVVGLALGALAAGVLELASSLARSGPLLAAVLAIAALALLTRGLHLDGLADLADGLGSRRPAAAALQIMRRSDIGPFGVVTLVLTLLIQVTALARADQAGRGAGAVIAAAAAARLAMTLACRRKVPAARGSGLGAGMAGSVHPLAAAALIGAALAGAAWADWRLAAGIAAGLAVSLALTALAVRRLGGITGDVLGDVAEVTGAACLLVIALS